MQRNSIATRLARIVSTTLLLLVMPCQAVRGDDTIVPPALSAAAEYCVNTEMIASSASSSSTPFVTLNKLSARHDVLQALLFIANFTIQMPAGSLLGTRSIYYQFDNSAPVYLESMSPLQSPKAFFVRLAFARFVLGQHRFSYGIVDSGHFISYGQRCFDAHDTSNERFAVTGTHA